MEPGDAVIWTNPDTGHTQVGIFVARYGTRVIIETTSYSGHLGLRYARPEDVKPTNSPQ